jgi:hypothetical protein
VGEADRADARRPGLLSLTAGLTFSLQEACSRALYSLPAPMPHESAVTALKTLGFSAPPFHDPFHDPMPRITVKTAVSWVAKMSDMAEA